MSCDFQHSSSRLRCCCHWPLPLRFRSIFRYRGSSLSRHRPRVLCAFRLLAWGRCGCPRAGIGQAGNISGARATGSPPGQAALLYLADGYVQTMVGVGTKVRGEKHDVKRATMRVSNSAGMSDAIGALSARTIAAIGMATIARRVRLKKAAAESRYIYDSCLRMQGGDFSHFFLKSSSSLRSLGRFDM